MFTSILNAIYREFLRASLSGAKIAGRKGLPSGVVES